MSWLRTIGHLAALTVILLLMKWLGLKVDATTACFMIGIAALHRTYDTPKPPAQE